MTEKKLRMMIITNILKKVEVMGSDLILIEGPKEKDEIVYSVFFDNGIVCSVFFDNEDLMQYALDQLKEEHIKLYPEKKQILLNQNEENTVKIMNEIFQIKETIFSS